MKKTILNVFDKMSFKNVARGDKKFQMLNHGGGGLGVMS